uniref:Yae1 domain-containing protein 1 n=1 Tax=Lygus hesperus TaxID=30085 RepID=A0A0A9Z6W4_LYGHE
MDDDIEIGQRTWKRATLPIQQDAFREGYEVGRKANYQQGFDAGYLQGFKNGFKMGLINGTQRANEDLNNEELDGLGLKSYDSPHRGSCVMCPSVNEPFTKEKMAEIASKYETLEQIFLKQETMTFPEEEIALILNKFEQTSGSDI